MDVLHVANKNYSSWSARPWVLMTALGLPFQEVLHRFDEGRPKAGQLSFHDVSPTGRLPMLQSQGIQIWDSLAIVEFLAESHPGIWPQDPVARAYARSACAEMHAGFTSLREYCPMSCAHRVQLRTWPPAVMRDLRRMDQLWRDGLERFGGPYLAGKEFTAVDAFFVPVAFRTLTYALPMLPGSLAYVNTLLEQPAVQDWYQQGLSEAPDASHDEAVRANAQHVDDLRLSGRTESASLRP